MFARQHFSMSIQGRGTTRENTFILIVLNFLNSSVRVQVESMMPNSCQLIIEKQNMAINGDDFAATNVIEDRRCLKKLKPLLGIGIVEREKLWRPPLQNKMNE